MFGKSSLMTTNKDKSFQLIKEEQLFCTDFFYYGRSVPFRSNLCLPASSMGLSNVF